MTVYVNGHGLHPDLRPASMPDLVLPRAKTKTAGIPGAESAKQRGPAWRSAACQRGDHRGKCSSLACSCSCHGPTGVPVRDGFQVTSVGMHKVAEAKRRDFKLQANNSAAEAENLRREGNLERAKKFLQQEAKWLAMAARDDEAICREYKAQAKDSVLGKGALALLALIAYYAFRQPAAPVNYDLNTYQPEPRTW